jgi:glyoxylase I family protein
MAGYTIAVMSRVTGIGGFFFRARDPDVLNRWYGEHLGVIMLESGACDDPGWSPSGRPLGRRPSWRGVGCA